MSSPALRPYPVEPLAGALHVELHVIGGHQEDREPQGQTALAEALGVSCRRVREMQAEGLSERVADRCAVRIGRHPSSVWGAAWWRDDEDMAPPTPAWMVAS